MPFGEGGNHSICPIVVLGTDDFQPRVAIALPCDPELGRGDRLRQMQRLGVATEIQQHADLPGLRLLGDLEYKPAVRRVAAHDGDENDPVRGEVAHAA